MTNRKRYKKHIVGVVLLCLGLGAIALIGWLRYPYRTTRQYTGCVISVRNNSLLLRFEIPSYDLKSENIWNSLYWVDAGDADFISNADSINTINELQPGMLVKATIKNLDATMDLISPSIPDMRTIKQIKTDGKIDDTLFQRGIDDLHSYGFVYEDGQVESALKIADIS